MRGKRLLVTFNDGTMKVYDCRPLLETREFEALKEEWLFRTVQADGGGYGVSWGEDIDLSESELWEKGVAVESDEAAPASPDGQHGSPIE